MTLPLDELKIDRCFIGTIESNPGNATIVKSTIELAHAFGMKTVAEGAETPAGVAILQRYGCDTVQGYYFSRPLPADQFNTWLLDHPVPGVDGDLLTPAALDEADGSAAELPSPRAAGSSETAARKEGEAA